MMQLSPGDCHVFDAGDRRFLYLAPSAAVMAIDDVSAAVLELLRDEPHSRDAIVSSLAARFGAADVDESLGELVRARAIRPLQEPVRRVPKIVPLTPVPLSTMVMNVTNQCNLSCSYCYEYGEDKIVQTDNGRQPKWMSDETARARSRRPPPS